MTAIIELFTMFYKKKYFSQYSNVFYNNDNFKGKFTTLFVKK